MKRGFMNCVPGDVRPEVRLEVRRADAGGVLANAGLRVAATYRSLARVAETRGLVAAQPAPAQDANAIVVTARTAARYHLRSIGDLASQAPRLVFGGPPECRERADCLPGLARTYGLRFKAFTATDTGGPVTRQALEAGQIGAGLLFTTDPSIPAQHLVILADTRALQPAENVTPAGPPGHRRPLRPAAARHAQCRLGPPFHGRAA